MDTSQIALDWITMAVLFGFLQGILVIFVFVNKQRFHQHRYLVFFFAVLLLVQGYSFLLRSGLMIDLLFLLNSNVPFILLFGPLIYLYTVQTLGYKVTRNELSIHIAPFIFYLAYSFNFFLQDSSFKHNILVEMLHLDLPMRDFAKTFPSDPWNIQGWVVVEFLTIHLVGYTLFSLLKIYNSSNQPMTKQVKSQVHWVKFLNTVLLLGGLVLFLSEGGIVNGRLFFESPFPNFSGDLFSTAAMYSTSAYLIRKPNFLNVNGIKYGNSSLSKSFMKEKLAVLKCAIETNQLYLDSNFSLDLLSLKTGLSKHHISQIINEELGCSFFDLTNNYRVEEAKKLLLESDYIKMEQLAYQLGYRSKSSFFNAFKKATKLTPSKYLEIVTV